MNDQQTINNEQEQLEHVEGEDDQPQHNFYNIDFYAFMNIPKSANENRIRTAFHKLSIKFHPDYYKPVRTGNKTSVDEQLTATATKFEMLSIIYAILMDDDLRRIYDSLGYDGVYKSEQYSEFPVYFMDPYEIFDDFFNGKTEADREYMLLHGPDGGSDDEEEGEENEAILDDFTDEIPLEEAIKSLENHHIHFDEPMPRPPAAVLVSSGPDFFSSKMKPTAGTDIWAELAKEFPQPKAPSDKEQMEED